jgi:spermidine/putrescine transport system permease protein
VDQLLLIAAAHRHRLSLDAREGRPRVYEFGPGNYIDFLSEPIYWNTLLRTGDDVAARHGAGALHRLPDRLLHRQARRKSQPRRPLPAVPDPTLGQRPRARLRLDRAAARDRGLSPFLQWTGLVSGPVEFLYNDVTVVIGLVYTVVLFMIVPLVSTLDGMDNALIEAGYNLGGSRFTVLRRIVIPYAMPGIVAGCIVVFMLTAGSYLTPILLGGKNSMWFTEQIYDQFITRYNWESGATFGVCCSPSPRSSSGSGLKLTGQNLANTVAKG